MNLSRGVATLGEAFALFKIVAVFLLFFFFVTDVFGLSGFLAVWFPVDSLLVTVIDALDEVLRYYFLFN